MFLSMPNMPAPYFIRAKIKARRRAITRARERAATALFAQYDEGDAFYAVIYSPRLLWRRRYAR